MSLPPLVLASASPRRKDLLESIGVSFLVRPVDIDESARPGEEPVPYVERLAREKASEQVGEGELVLAADTIVEIDGDLLGKPADAAAGRAMLRRLGGRTHSVHTGIALLMGDRIESAVEHSRVRIAELSDEEISWYIETGEPMDKAGSYAIQGIGGIFVESVDGSYSNVVGLPLTTTYRLFGTMEYDLRNFR